MGKRYIFISRIIKAMGRYFIPFPAEHRDFAINYHGKHVRVTVEVLD